MEDNLEKMTEIFEKALNDNDILLSSGGASKGKYDFTKDIAKNIGLNIHFTTTNIRPGRPLIFANKNEKLFFGLPGYPSALLVNAVEFLLPAIRKAAGMKEYQNRYFKAKLTKDVKAKVNRIDFIRGAVEIIDANVYFTPAYTQQTSNFHSTAISNALAVIDENEGSKKEGEIVSVIRI